jgi:hypothetical protein
MSDFVKQRTPTSIFALGTNPIMESVIHVVIPQRTVFVSHFARNGDYLVSQKQTNCLAELELSTCLKELLLLNKLMMIRFIILI